MLSPRLAIYFQTSDWPTQVLWLTCHRSHDQLVRWPVLSNNRHRFERWQKKIIKKKSSTKNFPSSFVPWPTQVKWPTEQVTWVGQWQAQVWQMTCDMWNVTREMRHVTHYILFVLTFISVGAIIRRRWEIQCLLYARLFLGLSLFSLFFSCFYFFSFFSFYSSWFF